jgi:glycosyltransferase involved in cell wall biosynthesis
LDYIFGRVPIAAIESALKGIPERLKPEFLVAEDLSTLVRKIIETIDDTERLNLMQTRAFELAEDVFNWDVNGRRFLEELKHRRAPSGMPSLPVPSRNS